MNNYHFKFISYFVFSHYKHYKLTIDSNYRIHNMIIICIVISEYKCKYINDITTIVER